MVKIIQNIPNIMLRKTIINKKIGSFTATSFDADEALAKKHQPATITVI
jgi:hypothetical protein